MELTAKYLREKFEKDLKELQDNCEHPSSTWMINGMIPGHYFGEVLVCDLCEKVLGNRGHTYADSTSNEFDPNEYTVLYNSSEQTITEEQE